MAVKKSGGVATFKNVAQDTVYVMLACDEKGTYNATFNDSRRMGGQ